MTGPAANVAKMQSHFLKQVLALAALPRLILDQRPRCCAEAPRPPDSVKLDTFSQLGRKMIHEAGEGDNVKNLAIVGGCSVIGLLTTVYVTNPLLLRPRHLTSPTPRELFNIFGNRKTAGR